MEVDPALEANAVVYKLKYPNSLADKISGKRLNISFGPYQVTNADLSWTRTGSRAEDPDPFFTSTKIRKSGNVTTTTKLGIGPTEILGFSRPAAEGEPSIEKAFQTIAYKFKVGKDITWNADCVHRSEKRAIQYKDTNSIELLSSTFTCQYTAEDKSADNKSNGDSWMLSMYYDGPITMTKKGKPNTLSAHSTGGNYIKPNGQAANISTSAAGYTWRENKGGDDKNIAAISVREEKPRVWLDKGNSSAMNQILSMANTGLLIYSWEIQHK